MDTQGDAFFVAFARASDALDAAEQAQLALEIPVRMGIHTGEPTLTPEGYVGMDVHRAARICAAAHGWQVLVSEATQRARGKRSPARSGRAPAEGSRAAEPALPGRRAGLPCASEPEPDEPARSGDDLVGRERELGELVELLGHDRGS